MGSVQPAAAVQNFNSTIYIDPPFSAMGGPSLQSQRNGNMLQDPAISKYNRTVYENTDNAPDAIMGSKRWTTLSAMGTMHPGAGRFPDVETFNRRNQNPRTLMDYAEPPYGNARGEKSLISWKFNTPEPLLKVNNFKAIQRQLTRERMCKF